ncbi:MAG: peptidoglycan editing factor PgeF [Candidatus Kapabacteria bacterium]|nr:peptidoglycan editing factor PgeF [Candidatus Kapabacteria bacterium]
MMKFIPALTDPELISGMTLIDVRDLPWPGASFSISESADASHVERSYQTLAGDLGVVREHIATVHQVHGNRCVEIESVDECRLVRNEQADALITSQRGVVLGVKLADCCGVLLHDPVRQVIAAIHSGWRGTAAGITVRTLEQFITRFGSDPAEVHAWLSPCASGRVYEVGEEVHSALPGYCRPLSESKWLFDNHRAIVDQLLRAGLRRDTITVDDACTITDVRYHSFRRDRGRSGRMLAFIGMREKP